MSDITYDSPATIADILSLSSRLRYLLQTTYNLATEDILSVRVDGDNFKLDVYYAETAMFRFKAKGLDNVIMTNPETGVMTLELDPALAQGIYRIVEDYAPNDET